MKAYPFVTVDVFTEERFGGNPLAVFPDARGLSDAQMQALAAEFNLSETTFVLPPDDPAHTARVRIFNRTHEMSFAGHPNVGTGYVLAMQGRDKDGKLRFEEISGLVEIKVDRDGAGVVTGATIAAPQPLSLGVRLSPEDVAACAGLLPADVITAGHSPMQASVGFPVMLAEVSAAALAHAVPNLAEFRRVLAQCPALDGQLVLYVYTRDGARVRARMFSPPAGTWEDPATGGAAAPLAALLLSLTAETNASYDVVQGVEMGRPSLLRATARRIDESICATVGGGCVPVLRGEAQV